MDDIITLNKSFKKYVSRKKKYYNKLFIVYSKKNNYNIDSDVLIDKLYGTLLNLDNYEDENEINIIINDLIFFDKLFDVILNDLSGKNKYVALKTIYFIKSFLKEIKNIYSTITFDYSINLNDYIEVPNYFTVNISTDSTQQLFPESFEKMNASQKENEEKVKEEENREGEENSISSKKENENNLNSENIIIPTVENYADISKFNYNLSQLKMIAKNYKLKISGNKNELISCLFSFGI